MESFYKIIEEAIADIEKYGYDSVARVNLWIAKIEQAARAQATPDHVVTEALARTMQAIYGRMIERGGYAKVHKGVSQFTIDRLKPKLRAELDRRIMASADLIKLNRSRMIAETIQRFSGWSTSIPPGGSFAVDRRDVSKNIRKAMQQLPFEERRVAIDQGHKFTSELNNIIAVNGGAIAAEWHSHYRQAGYNYRPDHKERDSKVYAIRGNWAIEKGLMNKGNGYTDEMTRPGEEVFCFPGDSKIPFANGVSKAYRHWYSGELTEIIMASGKSLRGTPNHPVLTTFGWKAMGLLDEGDCVIEIADEVFESFEKNQNDCIPTIAEIFRSLNKDGIIESFDLRPTDFHGDGADGKVDIVFSARHLIIDHISTGSEGSCKFQFPKSYNSFPIISSFFKGFNGLLLSSQRFMRGISQSFSAIFPLSIHADNIGGRCSSWNDALRFEPIHNSSSRYIETTGNRKTAFSFRVRSNNIGNINNHFGFSDSNSLTNIEIESVQSTEEGSRFPAENLCNLLDGLPFIAKSSNVIKVNKSGFSGHVYNLQTKDGWYVTNGIITHNCRCQNTYIYNIRSLPDSMRTAKGNEALK